MTMAGTDGTTMTFPSTTATIARTDAANTFTGHQTIEGVTSTGATGTGKFVFDNAPTITGHPTVEGVTATGATGTGKFVFDTAPTLQAATATADVVTTQSTDDSATKYQFRLNNSTGTQIAGFNGKGYLFVPVDGGSSTTPSIGNFASQTVGINFNSGFLQFVNAGALGGIRGSSFLTANGGGWSANSVSSDAGNTLKITSTAGTYRFGPAADAASPTAQSISVQNVLTGTSNVAGANFTISGSQGTGTGAGGSVIIQAAGAGNTGTAQNALNTIATFKDLGTAGTSKPAIVMPDSTSTVCTICGTTANTTGMSVTSGGTVEVISGAVRKVSVGTNVSIIPDLVLNPSTNAVIFHENGLGVLELKAGTDNKQRIYTNNGAYTEYGVASELLTLSTSGTTTDTSANLLPANAYIDFVSARITTTITTATDWKLGDATTAGRFTAANSTMTAGTTTVGMVHVDQVGAAGPRQTAAAKVRVTTTGTPGAGAIRITVHYHLAVAPTS
jgi:hypothetical protein